MLAEYRNRTGRWLRKVPAGTHLDSIEDADASAVKVIKDRLEQAKPEHSA